ncbi:MAG TPA: protein phosphatase 2C domain-containing protein [Ktedonobacterales bacterium]
MTEPREDASAASGGPATPHHLAPGDRLGGYVVTRVLASTDAGYVYLARAAHDDAAAGTAAGSARAEAVYQVMERPAGGYEDVRPLLALGLAHPRLLVPQALIARDGRDYLVVQASSSAETADGDSDSRPPLDAPGALAAGVALADALTYLHRAGVAHLRVSPATVTMRESRAQLGGLEDAQRIHPLDPNAGVLFARDANFLARTLGVLAGVVEGVPASDDPAARALAAIVARGAANEFATTEDVGEACAAALPQHEPHLPNFDAVDADRHLTFNCAAATSVGNVRTENQDASAIAVFDVRDDASAAGVASSAVGVFLVADGMGGEARGELASRIAGRVVLAEFARELVMPLLQTPVEAAAAGVSSVDVPLPRVAEILLRAGESANAQMRKLAAHLGKTTGTTLTALATVGARAALVHIGDSRAYLLRDGQLTQLTTDHTLLARMQAMEHPLLEDPTFTIPRNYLFRSLGQADEVDLDIAELLLSAGDRVLLCSDGLWDAVDDEHLRDALGSAATPHECARALVAAADAAGGQDNSTAVVLFVSGSAPHDAA